MKTNPPQPSNNSAKNKDIEQPEADRSTAPVSLLNQDSQEDIFG